MIILFYFRCSVANHGVVISTRVFISKYLSAWAPRPPSVWWASFERAVTPVPHGIFELPEVLIFFLKAQKRGVAHACAFKKRGLLMSSVRGRKTCSAPTDPITFKSFHSIKATYILCWNHPAEAYFLCTGTLYTLNPLTA